jgi:protein TonB
LESKKTPQANLENKKSVFLEIGLITALSIVLIAFEWSETDIASDFPLWNDKTTVEVDVIPIARTRETTPPPPPAPKPADLLKIVKNDTPVATEPVDFSSESTPKMQVDFSQLMIKKEREPDQVYDWVDEMPKFPGESQALMK